MSTAFKVCIALPLILLGHGIGFVYNLVYAGFLQGEQSVHRMTDKIAAKQRAREKHERNK